QFGIVYIDMEPAPGEGFDFVNKIKGGSVPSEFIPAVEKGCEEALSDAVEVVTPEEFLGDVIGDLSRRRGRVEGQERRGNALAVTAKVPLSEMFGYVTDLRSNTQGRATSTMQFDSYDEVPPNIADKIVEGRVGEPVPA